MKYLDEFRNQSFDLIITVCDQLREQCPTFPSDPHQIHWSIADPTTVDVVDMPTRFAETAQLLQTRIKYLLLSHRFVRADIL